MHPCYLIACKDESPSGFMRAWVFLFVLPPTMNSSLFFLPKRSTMPLRSGSQYLVPNSAPPSFFTPNATCPSVHSSWRLSLHLPLVCQPFCCRADGICRWNCEILRHTRCKPYTCGRPDSCHLSAVCSSHRYDSHNPSRTNASSSIYCRGRRSLTDHQRAHVQAV